MQKNTGNIQPDDQPKTNAPFYDKKSDKEALVPNGTDAMETEPNSPVEQVLSNHSDNTKNVVLCDDVEALVLECENKEWEVPDDFEAFSDAQCAKQMREFIPNFQVTTKKWENMKINPNQLKAGVVKGKDVTPLNPKVTTVIGTGVGKLPNNSYVTGAYCPRRWTGSGNRTPQIVDVSSTTGLPVLVKKLSKAKKNKAKKNKVKKNDGLMKSLNDKSLLEALTPERTETKKTPGKLYEEPIVVVISNEIKDDFLAKNKDALVLESGVNDWCAGDESGSFNNEQVGTMTRMEVITEEVEWGLKPGEIEKTVEKGSDEGSSTLDVTTEPQLQLGLAIATLKNPASFDALAGSETRAPCGTGGYSTTEPRTLMQEKEMQNETQEGEPPLPELMEPIGGIQVTLTQPEAGEVEGKNGAPFNPDATTRPLKAI